MIRRVLLIFATASLCVAVAQQQTSRPTSSVTSDQAHTQKHEASVVAIFDGNQTAMNDLLSHREVFQLLARSGMVGAKVRLLLDSPASSSIRQNWVDKAMAKHSFVWSSADGIDVGNAFIFPGADVETGIQYVFAAISDTQTVFGLGPIPGRNSIRLVDLSTNTAVELPSGGRPPARLKPLPAQDQVLGREQLGIDLPGVASNIAATASCLWDSITSTLSVHSWSDFANLACQINSRGDEAKAMWNFGKEIAGCSSLGVADCFFLVSDIALFVGNASCRPDWVNACINPPPPGGGGAATPATILGISPFSTPAPGRQFLVQIHVFNLLVPSASVVITGPGCPTTTSCVVPSGVITFIGTDFMNVPLTLAQGSFTIYVSQLGKLSNGWPLSVGAPPAEPPTTGSLNVVFSPNPVYRSSDNAWYYEVTVNETAGKAVTLTGMTIGGGDYTNSISKWFGTNTVPANGHVSVNIKTTGSSGAMVWEFSSGRTTWSAPVNLN